MSKSLSWMALSLLAGLVGCQEDGGGDTPPPDMGMAGEPLGLDITEIPVLRALEGEGIRVVDGQQTVLKAEAVKTPEEVARMRRAARACEAGMHAALEACRPGATENDVAAEMHRASIAGGSEYLGHPPLIVAGERSAVCFVMWRRREIGPGEVDVGVQTAARAIL